MRTVIVERTAHNFPEYLSSHERATIEAREQRVNAWRRSLPKRKVPEHEKPGPISIIQLRR